MYAHQSQVKKDLLQLHTLSSSLTAKANKAKAKTVNNIEVVVLVGTKISKYKGYINDNSMK